MPSPRWSKVLRDLTSHPSRTALVVLSIAVGIFATGAILGARQVLLREFERDFANSARSSISLTTSDTDQATIDAVAARPDTIDAEGRRVVLGRIAPGGVAANAYGTGAGRAGQQDETVWASLQLDALSDFNMDIDRIELVDGTSWPPRTGEILIEAAALNVYDINVGDTVTVEVGNEQHDLRVAGFVHDLNAIPTQFFDRVTGFVTMDTAVELGQPNAFNTVLVNVDPSLGRSGAGDIAVSIRDDLLAPRGVSVDTMNVPAIGYHFFGDIFKAVSVLLLGMALMALFASGFLVVTTVSAIVVSQVRQIGIMKSIGGQRWQIARLFFGLVFSYGVAALAVGVPLGLTAGYWFTDYAAGVLNFRVVDFGYPAWVVGVLVAIGLLLPILAASGPILSGVRRPIVDALNPAAGYRYGSGLLDRVLARVRWLSRPVLLALRSTFAHKSRLALTLLTLAFASGVVMAVFSARASLNQTADNVGAWWGYDAQAILSAPAPQDALETQAAKVSGVSYVETWLDGRTSLARDDGTENEQYVTMGIPAGSKIVNFQYVAGAPYGAGEGQVVFDTELANDEPSYQPGTTVHLSVGGRTVDRTLSGIVTGSLRGQTLYIERDDLARLQGIEGAATRVVVKIERTSATESDPAALEAAQARVADDLETQLEEHGYRVSSTRTSTAAVAETRSQLGILTTFLIIMAAALALVGVISLTGSMTLNVLESTREMGVMRSIGASHAAIYRIYITQGIVIGTLAWAFGAVLSWPLSWLLMEALQGALGMPLAYTFSWSGIGLWLVLVWLISAIGSLLPAWRAARVSIREAITYE